MNNFKFIIATIYEELKEKGVVLSGKYDFSRLTKMIKRYTPDCVICNAKRIREMEYYENNKHVLSTLEVLCKSHIMRKTKPALNISVKRIK